MCPLKCVRIIVYVCVSVCDSALEEKKFKKRQANIHEVYFEKMAGHSDNVS